MASQIVVFGNVKGGVGKTTLAVNCAIARAASGRDVLLIDGDDQRTAQAFTQLRAERKGTPGYTAVSLQGAAIRTQVRQLRVKYEDILIDVGGRDNGSLRAALTVAQVLVVPVQPRSFDMWALDQVSALVSEAREINDVVRVLVALNLADAQGRDNEEAAGLIRSNPDFELLEKPLVRRKVYSNASASGMAVFEYSPKDAKAVEELAFLVDYTFSLNNNGSVKYAHRTEPSPLYEQ